MKRPLFACAGIVALGTTLAAHAQFPKTHRLEATPSTVVYGYYWSDAKPALHIDSGDIIDVDTLLTNTPAGLAKGGVPDNKIQASLKAIVDEVTGGLLGLPVALLDLAEDGEAIASALARVGRPQCVFTVPTLVDAVVVGKSLQHGPKFIVSNC